MFEPSVPVSHIDTEMGTSDDSNTTPVLSQIGGSMRDYVKQKNERLNRQGMGYRSHFPGRLRALLINQWHQQRRQYCQNICQVVLPLLMLFVPAAINLILTLILNLTPSIPPFNQVLKISQPSYFVAADSCCTTVINATAPMRACPFRPEKFSMSFENEEVKQVVGYVNYEGKASGLLDSKGFHQEYAYEDRQSWWGDEGTRCYNTPFFVEMTSPDAIDDSYTKNVTDIEAYCREHQLEQWECKHPDVHNSWSAIHFREVDMSNGKFSHDIQFDGRLTGDGLAKESFLRLQYRLLTALLEKYGSSFKLAEASAYGVAVQAPVQEIITSLSDSLTLLAFPLSLSLLLPIFMSRNVSDKSKGLDEYIRMFGVRSIEKEIINGLVFYVNYAIIMVVVILVGVIFQFRFFYSGAAWLYIPMLLLWGWTMIGMANLFSKFLSNARRATITGFIFCLATFTIAALLNIFVFDSGLPHPLYMLFPPFAFVRMFATIMIGYTVHSIRLSSADAYICFVYLLCETIVLLIIGSSVPYEILRRLFNKIFGFVIERHDLKTQAKKQKDLSDEILNRGDVGLLDNASEFLSLSKNFMDDDVIHETQNVLSGKVQEDAVLVLRGLTKTFRSLSRKHTAVDGFSLGIRDEECFGLLGHNGAGKSTTINMISGLLSPSSGTVLVGGYDVRKDLGSVRQKIGVCPQFDIFFDKVSVEEHLLFYARLRGVPFLREKSHVRQIIEDVGLEEARRRIATKLSGGMKRRLSIAIAMIGDPLVSILDEPTTGLDAASRRGVWEIVERARQKRCIILSSHSMSEVEALCSRVGILNGGRLCALGSLAHLKSKFGEGYRLTISCSRDNFERAHAFIMNDHVLPQAVLTNSYAGLHFYRVKNEFVKLSKLFEVFNKNKSRVGIRDWSITESTLEEVFLKLDQGIDSNQ